MSQQGTGMGSLSLATLADQMTIAHGGRATPAEAEMALRTAQAQIDAARYMKWSVIAIAITSGLTALFSYLSWAYPQH